MTPRTTIHCLLGAILIFLASSPVAGETSPEAREWLAKLTSTFEQGPFRVDYTADLNLATLGFSGTLQGRFAQADATHSRMELELELTVPPGMSSEPMRMKVLNVSDGTTVWTEMENPALGGRQVSKVALADVEKLNAGATAGLAIDPAGMDPVAQLKSLSETMEFAVVERGDGRVTLRGRLTDQTNAMLAQLAGPNPSFLFVLDERTGFPIELRAEGDPPFVVVRFSDPQRPEALPAELFEYTVPAGVAVTDRGALPPSTSQ